MRVLVGVGMGMLAGCKGNTGADGTPTGYVKEQAGTYVRSFLDNEYLFSVDVAKANMAKIQEQLLSEGYTMYLDGYTSYFFNDNFYKAAQQMDQAGDMHFVLGTAWELDSWMDVDKTLAKASDTKKYESARIKTNWIKLFMDGTVESGTGFVDPLYPDGKQGSIKTGKYADFLLVTKDVLTCPVTEIHEAKPAATYFEGKKVFSM